MLVWLESIPLAVWVRESPSVWAQPTVLTLHTMGMAVLVGASWVLDLRLLGISRNVPLSAFRWVFRAVTVGLIVNLVTGVLLFAQRATTWGTSIPFLIKMCLVIASVATLVPIRSHVFRSDAEPARGQRQRSSPGARLDPRVVRCRDRGPSSRLPGPIGGQMTSLIAVNVAHLHLLLNHVPTVGSVVALGLLLLALVRRDEPLKHAGLEVLFVIAVVTLPVYMSGVAAHLELRDRPELSDNAMRVHQDAALAGFAVTEFAGFVAWIALWQSRRRGRAARGARPCRDAAVDCGARAHGSRGDSWRRDSPSGDPDRPLRGRRRACPDTVDPDDDSWRR